MEKTDLSTIDREKEPNFYAFCEWANKEIDNGLIDIKGFPISSCGSDCETCIGMGIFIDNSDETGTGEVLKCPKSVKPSSDDVAKSYMALLTSPRVPCHDID